MIDKLRRSERGESERDSAPTQTIIIPGFPLSPSPATARFAMANDSDTDVRSGDWCGVSKLDRRIQKDDKVRVGLRREKRTNERMLDSLKHLFEAPDSLLAQEMEATICKKLESFLEEEVEKELKQHYRKKVEDLVDKAIKSTWTRLQDAFDPKWVFEE